MNNNKHSSQTSARTNTTKGKQQDATSVPNKFGTEFARETDVQAAELEKAYVEAKENQKDDQ